tara:strand:+ start:2688 stop:2864 length:177 start_codon:yes stop_codon:yes gene_type:complete
MDTIKITWKKSTIGYSHRQRKIIESLGLKRLNHTVEHQKTDSIMGMINKVKHLVDVTE